MRTAVSTSASQPHSRLVAQAAKEVLSPLGVFQRGRSRTWLDDHGFWLTVVEFQPSSWSKGSYLNAGVMWLWTEQDHFFFDVGYRVEQFLRYESEAQFLPEARRLALAARERVLEFRDKFPSIAAAAQFLTTRAETSHDSWHLFDAGVAAGYLGNSDEALGCFAKLIEKQPEYDWQKTLQAKVQQLTELINDPPIFKMRIEEAVRNTRNLLKLPARPSSIS